jgi:hypothetical protein
MGTTWVARMPSYAEGVAWVNEPDNEWPHPFTLRAKLPLGRYPILGEHDPDLPEYRELWESAFAGFRQSGPLVSLADRLETGRRPETICGGRS